MRRLVVLGLLAAMSGCGLTQGNAGVLYGFVVDGLTGVRLNFFNDQSVPNSGDASDSTDQIYVVMKGAFIRARPCEPRDATAANQIDTSGCYRVTDLADEASFPLFAQRQGYQTFESRITYSAAGTGYYGNIRMFPAGYQVSYELLVSYKGAPVPGAAVNCRYQSTANAFELGEDFLQPEVSTTAEAISGVSDANGIVSLDGTQLVTGAAYLCEAHLTNAVHQDVLSGQKIVVAGVTAPHVAIELTTSAVDPLAVYAVRSNVDDPADLLGNNASVVVTFNRPVELVPGTADCMTATLVEPDFNGNAAQGALPVNAFANGASEQVTASMSADGLTLTLSYKTPTIALDTGDRGTTVTFDGVFLRPSAGSGQDDASALRRIGAVTGCSMASSPTFGGAVPLPNLRTAADQSSVVRLF